MIHGCVDYVCTGPGLRLEMLMLHSSKIKDHALMSTSEAMTAVTMLIVYLVDYIVAIPRSS